MFEVGFVRSKIRRAAYAVSYVTDQPTPCDSQVGAQEMVHLVGIGWARVVGGQIGRLSLPLHRVDGGCSGSTNLKMQTHGKHEQSRRIQNTPRNPRHPAAADNLETARAETHPTR